MLEIKLFSKEEIIEIYHKYMVEDFPKAELKPLKWILEKMEEGVYKNFGLFEGDTMYAYASFIEEDGYALLDYLAVNKEHRGGGYGSRFLSEFKKLYPDIRGIWLECESVASAANEEEQELRKRRIGFYLRNGVCMSTIQSCVFDVEYSILYFPMAKPLEEVAQFEVMDRIYFQMFGSDIYKNDVRMWKNEGC